MKWVKIASLASAPSSPPAIGIATLNERRMPSSRSSTRSTNVASIAAASTSEASNWLLARAASSKVGTRLGATPASSAATAIALGSSRIFIRASVTLRSISGEGSRQPFEYPAVPFMRLRET
jgi:hypothetical protein